MKRGLNIYLTMLLLPFVPTKGCCQMLISELLYQPRSGEAEYVELYNGGGDTLQLDGFHIVRWIGDSLGRHYPLPKQSVAPGNYVVLTKDASSVMSCYHDVDVSKMVECNLPPFPDAGGSVILTTTDSMVVDRLDYSPQMHSPLLRNRAGVSLERRSFLRDAAEEGNWFSASSTSGYGTPTRCNSQSTEFLAEETSFHFSSTVVSPNDDGYNDVLQIDYSLPDPTLAAHVMVYSAQGLPIRKLLNAALLGSHGTLIWDCQTDTGQLAERGRYVVEIVLYNTSGERQRVRRMVAVAR